MTETERRRGCDREVTENCRDTADGEGEAAVDEIVGGSGVRDLRSLRVAWNPWLGNRFNKQINGWGMIQRKRFFSAQPADPALSEKKTSVKDPQQGSFFFF